GVDGHEVVRVVGERLTLFSTPVLRAGVPGVAEGDDVVDLDGLAQAPLDHASRVRVMQDPVGHIAVGPVLVGDLGRVAIQDLVAQVAATTDALPAATEMLTLVVICGAVLLGYIQAGQLLRVDARRSRLKPRAPMRGLFLGHRRQRTGDPLVDLRKLRTMIRRKPGHQGDGHNEGEEGAYTRKAARLGSRAAHVLLSGRGRILTGRGDNRARLLITPRSSAPSDQRPARRRTITR